MTQQTFCFAVFDKYMTISGFQIEETIDRETSGDLEKLLLAVGNYVLIDLEPTFFVYSQVSLNCSCYEYVVPLKISHPGSIFVFRKQAFILPLIAVCGRGWW